MKDADPNKETHRQQNTSGDGGDMSLNYEKKVFSTWHLWPYCEEA